MGKKDATIQTTKLGNQISGKKTQKQTKGNSKDKNGNDDKAFSRNETIRFFSGLLLLVVSLIMLLAYTSYLFTGAEDQILLEQSATEGFSNYAGALGAYCAAYFFTNGFGLATVFITIFMLVAAMKLTGAYKVKLWRWFLHCAFLTIWVSVAGSFFLQNIFENSENWNFINPGGGHGQYVCGWLGSSIGTIGTFILLVFIALCYLTYLSRRTIRWVRRLLNPVDYIKSKQNNKKTESDEGKESVEPIPTTIQNIPEENTDETDSVKTIDFELPESSFTDAEEEEEEDITEQPAASDEQQNGSTPAVSLDIAPITEEEVASKDSVGTLEPFDPKLDLENYAYPTLELLDKRPDDNIPIDMEEQNKNKDQIIEVLQNFGVGISSVKATVGPTITLYEITPAKGVRISRIRNLEDDIALSLSALGIRIIAPIPGKGTIGIEVPNAKPHIVSMESILNSRKFRESEYELPIALGKTITNEVFMVDLAKMPHLLVAGATGQGKSVGLNVIITSLLYKKHPAELKFVMVDPKKVELSIYAPIENHFLAKVADENSEPIITDVNKVVQTLKSLCCEMDTRYDLLKKAKARNIKEYNAKFKSRQLNPENGPVISS